MTDYTRDPGVRPGEITQLVCSGKSVADLNFEPGYILDDSMTEVVFTVPFLAYAQPGDVLHYVLK